MKKRLLSILIASTMMFSIFCGAVSAQSLLDFIKSPTQFFNFEQQNESDKKEGKCGRIDKIGNSQVTLTLGSITPPEKPEQQEESDENQTTEPKDLSESFTASSETVTLTVEDDRLKEELGDLKAGDIVMVHYNDDNVLEDIKKVNDTKDRKPFDGKAARIDSITEGQVTLTLGSITPSEKPEQQEESDENQTTELKDLSESFVASTETVTLTVEDDRVKEELGEFKAGDIVMVHYSDDNVLEDIKNVNDIKDRKPFDGKAARINSITENQVTLTLGSITPPEKLEQQEESDENQTTEPKDLSESFVASTETVTLTVEDDRVKEELSKLKANDIVMIQYNDQKQLQNIHKVDEGFKGGPKMGFERSNQKLNKSAEIDNSKSSNNTAYTQSTKTQNTNFYGSKI